MELDIFTAEGFEVLASFAPLGFWTHSEGLEGTRRWWPSAEHYFQAGKFWTWELQEQIRQAREPGIAKHLGRTLGPLRSDWDDVKRARLHRALLEKLWAHSAAREVLLSIPAGTRIVNGNTVDVFFGTGPDGSGLNVMGQELQALRSFFEEHQRRWEVPVEVAEIGEPFDPRSIFVDLTGVMPAETTALVSDVLGIDVEAIETVDFVYDGGFERAAVMDFQEASDMECFLAQNFEDCKLEVRLMQQAVVTLWNATEDSYLGRADVCHLCQSAAKIESRLREVLPLLRHANFKPRITVAIDGDPEQPLTNSILRLACEAAAKGGDVLINGYYTLPTRHVFSLAAPAAESPLVHCGSHTELSAVELASRIRGMIWGAALGDAVGLATEFMDRSEAAKAYPDGCLSPTSRIQDKHRKRWLPGDWTDDTDQLVLLLDAIVAGKGLFDPMSFSAGLKRWCASGFPELGDSAGLGVGQTVKSVLEHVAFDVAPEVAADAIWRQSGCSLAANGAIMRCAVASIGCFWDDQVVSFNAAASAAVTHADPRCASSCVCIALLLARVLMGCEMSSPAQRRELAVASALQSVGYLAGGDWDELLRHVNVEASGLRGLQLGGGGIGYTYKPLGAACWAFQHAEDFREAVQAIAMEAGDADSNATVAGALLGARLGYSALPAVWLSEMLPAQRDWLNAKIDTCLAMLGLS